jgi:hypothetical protein
MRPWRATASLDAMQGECIALHEKHEKHEKLTACR